MRRRLGVSPRLLVAVAACFTLFAMTVVGAAGASETDLNLPVAENLVEIKVADRAAIEQLMADAESIGAEFNDHYLRENEDDGTLTAQVLGDDTQIDQLRAMGYEVTGTIEDEEAYWDRIAERLQAMEAEQRAAESVSYTHLTLPTTERV